MSSRCFSPTRPWPINPGPSFARSPIIQKLRHPQTDEWVVTTIRQVFPTGGDTWTRDFYAGDLQQSPDLAPYRSVVFNRTRHADGTETFLATVSDRGNDGTMVVTSRVSRTGIRNRRATPESGK